MVITAKCLECHEEKIGAIHGVTYFRFAKARQVDELASAVANASKEQSQGIEQVNTAVAQMDKVTQSNASSAEESAAAAEELNAQAETMRESVQEMSKLVHGNRQAELAASRPRTNGHGSPRLVGEAISRQRPGPPFAQRGVRGAKADKRLAAASHTVSAGAEG